MKDITKNIFNAVLVTCGFILICYLILFLFGKLNMETASLVGSLSGMYLLPILFGNLMLQRGSEKLNQSLLLRSLKSVGLSMMILFVMNFILWVIFWGAPIQDLFTERNILLYLIGFCLMLVILPIFNYFYLNINSKQSV